MDWSDIARGIAMMPFDEAVGAEVLMHVQASIGSTTGDYLDFLATRVTPEDAQRPFRTFEREQVQRQIIESWAAVTTSISGRIESLDPSVSVAEQVVIARNNRTSEVYRATSFRDGGFVFPGLDAGSHTLTVERLQVFRQVFGPNHPDTKIAQASYERAQRARRCELRGD